MIRRSKPRLSGWMVLTVAIAIAAIAISLAAIDSNPRTITVRGKDFVDVEAPERRGAVQFFSWQDKTGSRINFLLARAEDGGVKSALDACSRCFSYHQGYS